MSRIASIADRLLGLVAPRVTAAAAECWATGYCAKCPGCAGKVCVRVTCANGSTNTTCDSCWSCSVC